MKELYKHFQNKIYFESDINLSPISLVSIGVAKYYCEKIHNDEIPKKPLFFSFPLKHLGSLWLSTGLLTQFFVDDFCLKSEEHYKNLNLKKGTKIEIFNTIAEVQGFYENGPVIKFKDTGGVQLNERYLSNINLCPKNRTCLNKHNLYAKNRKEFKSKLNAISKILGANSIINPNILSSKVVLITGRGQTGQIIEGLKENSIYDEPLEKILKKDENLIIKSSLEFLKPFFVKKEESKFDEYTSMVKDVFEEVEEEEDPKIQIIKDCIQNDEIFTKRFKEALSSLEEDFLDEGYLHELIEEFPEIKEGLGYLPKVVILNDVEQIINYKETINNLLENKIPIIIITDKSPKSIVINKTEEIINSTWPDCYKFNWDRRKIEELVYEGDCLDKMLWESCLRYCKQTINFKSYANKLEDDFTSIRRYFLSDDLENYGKLRSLYRKYLEPAIVLYKNDSGKAGSDFNELVNSFLTQFKKIQHNIPNNIVAQIDDYLRKINVSLNIENVKPLNSFQNVFTQKIRIDLKKYTVPSFQQSKSLENENITFPGYPFEELRGKYFYNAVFNDIIPIIDFIGWCKESQLTYNYLVKAISGTWITDNFNSILSSKLRQNSEYSLKSEINNRIIIEEFSQIVEQDLIEFEQGEKQLADFRYDSIKKSSSDADIEYLVKVNVINFSDDSYFLVPHTDRNSKKFLIKNSQGNITFTEIEDLEEGDILINHNIEKGELIKRNRSNNKYSSIFNYLDFWREKLVVLYERSNKSIDLMKKELEGTKNTLNLERANPSELNIRRWLSDHNMYAPINENLIMILSSVLGGKIDFELNQVINAQKSAKKLTRNLKNKFRDKLTSELTNKDSLLDDDFIMELDGIEIFVQTKIISSIEFRDDLEVEYSYTYKILC